jgi:uncharacterized membrane protein
MTTIDLAKVLLPALVGIAAFCYYFAHLAEKGASDLAKRQLSQLTHERRLLPVIRAAFVFFLYASDKYFGPRLISWQALRRSAALSIVWIIFVLVMCVALYPNYTSWLGNKMSRQLILQSAGILLLVSLLIDYISVCVTRAIVQTAARKGRSALIFAVIADLVISVLLFYIFFTATKSFLQPHTTPMGLVESLQVWLSPGTLPVNLQFLQSLNSNMLIPRGENSFDIKGGLLTEIVYAFPESVLFFSSLLTSIWLWLYVIAYALLFVTVRLDRVGTRAKRYLQLSENPIYALAFAMVISCALLFLVILMFSAVGVF